jgi:hypothetical protein
MRVDLDTDALAHDSIDNARELIRVIRMAPWTPPQVKTGESNEDYEARCECMHTEYVLATLATTAQGSRQAVIMILREYYESGIWTHSQLIEHEGVKSAEEFLKVLLDNTRQRLMAFMTVVIPEIRRHAPNIPELKPHGGKIPDDIYGAVLDESGNLMLPRIVWMANSLVSRLKKGGGVSLEAARTICVALLTGDWRILDQMNKLNRSIEAQAKAIKAENPGLSEDELAVEIMKRQEESAPAELDRKFYRIPGDVKRDGEAKVYTIRVESHGEQMHFEARLRTLVEFRE